MSAIQTHGYWCNVPLCAVNWDQSLPTGRLISEVVFPSKYAISDPKCLVETLESNAPDLKEMDRIQESDGFKAQQFYDRFTLLLSVAKPLRGHRYRITWTPPSEKSLGG